MTLSPIQPAALGGVVCPRCPLCHTLDRTVTAEALQAGAGWRCTACGQAWSARRLETVAAYAQYVADHQSTVVAGTAPFQIPAFPQLGVR